jgi:intraflagellar transport protein 122
VYHAYHAISRYIDEPFTSHSPEDLLSIANYLLNVLNKSIPFGVSKFNVLFAAAKLGKQLGAFKTARAAYDQLQSMKIPPSFREHVYIGNVLMRSKPVDDAEETLPICYRCTTPNNLWGGSLACSNCRHPFIMSRYSFEALPLVEFVPNVDISDEEAQQLINDDSQLGASADKWSSGGDTQVLTMDEDEPAQDAFLGMLERFEGGSSSYEPLRVDRDVLRSMPSHQVYVQHWPEPLHTRYFRNVLPDMDVSSCSRCQSFFVTDDWEHLTLKTSACPYCRVKLGVDEDGDDDAGRSAAQISGAATHSSTA